MSERIKRAHALSGAICIALAVVVAGCEGGTKTKVGHATDQRGSGGAGRAGGRPSEPLEAAEVHPESPPDEGARRGTVRGTIIDTGPSRVVIADREGRRFWLNLSTRTIITEDGRQSSALALDNGTRVTASFISEEPTGRRVITRIAVTPQQNPRGR